MFDLLFRNERDAFIKWKTTTRRDAIFDCDQMIAKDISAGLGPMKEFSFKSSELDVYGRILYNGHFDWGWPLFEEELQKLLIKKLKNETKTIFTFSFFIFFITNM